jgi:nucleoside-diphosphate-sugar epimerase
MKVLITGGCGFLGLRLAQALLGKGHLPGTGGSEVEIEEIVLCDLSEPVSLPKDRRLTVETLDITDAQAVRDTITDNTGVVFHLAAVVSAGAEADFDLGMRVNVHGTLNVLEACRKQPNAPRVIFTSSVATYGGDMPHVIEDMTALTPQSSYGTQKVLGELLLNDYSRKGYIDGRGLRLPTIVVRPGKPNRAASSFASSIIREPLQGKETECPVPPETLVWIMSPRRAVEALIHAAELPAAAWGRHRTVALAGLTLSVADMVEGLRRVAGDTVVKRIRWQRDPDIEKIICSWPARFASKRAQSLGFKADRNIDEIIRAFIEEELGGRFVA